ncbi:sulfatase [Aquimarina celericrescens]|uniref:Sulfatase n=1 Tax=Aquimarina celericrescens TaxID=1964542 RepID=A0ABW5AZT9_9FLAO|nr:sulfatase [Aquimarina celericrescens]
MKNSVILIVLSLSFLFFGCKEDKKELKNTDRENYNILFISVDDLRPELGTYGVKGMITPNIDSLANKSYQFNNAFCNIPVCGASRASIMTGIYPALNRFVDHKARADEDVPEAITIPAHFKKSGYSTFSLGKVFHFPEDSPESWSKPAWQPQVPHLSKDYVIPKNRARQAQPDKAGPYYEIADVPDSVYVDGMISNKAIRVLDSLKEVDKPFFLAVGFLRPHLPFSVPKKYWNLYPEEEIEIPNNRFWPKDAPGKRPFGFGELKKYQYVPKKYPVPDSIVHRMNRGYRASISYVDQMIGDVLNKLKETGQDKNTIIVLWGDHGFHLGEHDLFCKHVTFQNTIQVPLIIKVPDMQSGKKVEGMVEYVDIFPTLCELTGLQKPETIQGKSFMPLLKNIKEKGKEYIFSRFKTTVSVRSDRYFYVQFIDDKGIFVNEMLFDHQTDPYENQNIAHLPDMDEIVTELKEILEKHNKTIN